MDYKSMMGFNKKKKTIEKESKPKSNEVLESLKEEFGYVNEGPSYEYANHIKKIDKLYDTYWDSVKDFEKLLKKKGLKREALTISAYYNKLVGKFDTIFKKIVRKLL